jgi:hypothetical protein
MPALPRISWCADKGFLYFDIERKKYTIPVLHCYREFTQNLGQPLYEKNLASTGQVQILFSVLQDFVIS